MAGRSRRIVSTTCPANAVKSSLRPTKSVSQFTSTATPHGAVSGHARGNDAFLCGAVGTLRADRSALLAQILDRRFHVAVRCFEGALAIHHPCAGLVAQAS